MYSTPLKYPEYIHRTPKLLRKSKVSYIFILLYKNSIQNNGKKVFVKKFGTIFVKNLIKVKTKMYKKALLNLIKNLKRFLLNF